MILKQNAPRMVLAAAACKNSKKFKQRCNTVTVSYNTIKKNTTLSKYIEKTDEEKAREKQIRRA